MAERIFQAVISETGDSVTVADDMGTSLVVIDRDIPLCEKLLSKLRTEFAFERFLTNYRAKQEKGGVFVVVHPEGRVAGYESLDDDPRTWTFVYVSVAGGGMFYRYDPFHPNPLMRTTLEPKGDEVKPANFDGRLFLVKIGNVNEMAKE